MLETRCLFSKIAGSPTSFQHVGNSQAIKSAAVYVAGRCEPSRYFRNLFVFLSKRKKKSESEFSVPSSSGYPRTSIASPLQGIKRRTEPVTSHLPAGAFIPTAPPVPVCPAAHPMRVSSVCLFIEWYRSPTRPGSGCWCPLRRDDSCSVSGSPTPQQFRLLCPFSILNCAPTVHLRKPHGRGFTAFHFASAADPSAAP